MSAKVGHADPGLPAGNGIVTPQGKLSCQHTGLCNLDSLESHINVVKVKSMQRSGTEAIRTQLKLSKPKLVFAGMYIFIFAYFEQKKGSILISACPCVRAPCVRPSIQKIL